MSAPDRDKLIALYTAKLLANNFPIDGADFAAHKLAEFVIELRSGSLDTSVIDAIAKTSLADDKLYGELAAMDRADDLSDRDAVPPLPEGYAWEPHASGDPKLRSLREYGKKSGCSKLWPCGDSVLVECNEGGRHASMYVDARALAALLHSMGVAK